MPAPVTPNEDGRERNTFVSRYESVSDLLDFIEGNHNAMRKVESARSGKSSFTGKGFRSWRDCRSTVEGVWDEGLRAIEEMIRELEDVDIPKPQSARRRLSWSEDSGDEVCTDRLWGGSPYWREMPKRHMVGGRPVVTVIGDVGTACMYDWTEVLWRGVAAIAVADRLEEAGYRCCIKSAYFAFDSYGDGKARLSFVTLKNPEDAIDIAGVASCVSSWFWRIVCFASFWDRKGVLTRHYYGFYPYEGRKRFPDWTLPVIADGDEDPILICSSYSKEAAVKEATEVLEKFSPQEVQS